MIRTIVRNFSDRPIAQYASDFNLELFIVLCFRTMGKDDKEDTGFGFKDKAKAEDTLRLLEEHDLNYRRLTVRGLLGRAKRVLSSKSPLRIPGTCLRNLRVIAELVHNRTVVADVHWRHGQLTVCLLRQ